MYLELEAQKALGVFVVHYTVDKLYQVPPTFSMQAHFELYDSLGVVGSNPFRDSYKICRDYIMAKAAKGNRLGKKNV